MQSVPEILPPESPRTSGRMPGYDPGYASDPRPPAPPVRRGDSWASAPATYTLVGINCAVYLATAFSAGSVTDPTSGQLFLWGVNFGAYVVHGEWWRLLTAAFMHVGVLHLATNMWCLWNLGLLGEPLLGPVGVIAVYVLTGIAGNLLSVAVHPQVPGAGASGAVFGLAGVLILLLKARLLPVPQEEVRRLRRNVIYFAVLNFVLGGTSMFLHTSIRIDNMAHLGGFLCGLTLGGPLVPRIGAARNEFSFRSWATYSAMGVLLLALAYGLARAR